MGELVMPAFLGLREATVVKWLVSPGERLKPGRVALVVETSRGASLVECTRSGVLEAILVEEGATVPVGTKLAEILAEHAETPALKESLPPAERLSRFSGVLLFSDFLDPLEKIGERLTYLASDGVTGYMVQVLDPAEETLPYKGRTEFLGMEGGERWLADRVETLRPEYQKRLRAHRAGLEEVAHRLGWSFLVHHTDRPAAEPLLKLIMRLQDSGHDYRWTSSSAANSGAAG